MEQEVPILFPNCLTHSLVAEAVVKSEELVGATVVSAGEFSCMDLMDIKCHGRSSTLNVESRGEEDDRLIRSFDYNHGLL